MEEIKEMIVKIKTEYGNDKYVEVSNDRYFQNVSTKLRRLWYSLDEMSIASIDTYYYRIFDLAYPDYTAEIFRAETMKLVDALTQEFALLIKSKKSPINKINQLILKNYIQGIKRRKHSF